MLSFLTEGIRETAGASSSGAQLAMQPARACVGQTLIVPGDTAQVFTCRGATLTVVLEARFVAVSLLTAWSCGARSHTCTWPVSPQVATMPGLCGEARMRLMPPWCGTEYTWSTGFPGLITCASSSSSLSLLSSSLSSLSRPPAWIRLSCVRRRSWMLLSPGFSACVPATRYSVCGNAVRPSPSSSRRMSKLRGVNEGEKDMLRGQGGAAQRALWGSFQQKPTVEAVEEEKRA